MLAVNKAVGYNSAMADDSAAAPLGATEFETDPLHYRHWKLSVDGAVARLALAVQEEEGLGPEYTLKQNSYDLGVDIELADAIQRIRFEYPAVKVFVLTSAVPRIFCAGANIYMLGKSTHAFKVNFCKFTNETRIGLEDLARNSGVTTIAALNGTAAGGGYELALACEQILLVDDGNSAVSFPEVPLLAVLPGTGGLTRLVDKRKIRRDRADIFCTIAEGIKGRRAKDWGLVDEVPSKSGFDAAVAKRTSAATAASKRRAAAPVTLPAIQLTREGADDLRGRYVHLRVDQAARVADLIISAPPADEPTERAAMLAKGAELWALRAFRELDLALLALRLDLPGINLVRVRTVGDGNMVTKVDAAILANVDDGFLHEVQMHMARTLRRYDLSAKSFFALVEPGSAFAGSLLELLLGADRAYALIAEDGGQLAASAMNDGALTMTHGVARLLNRFCGDEKAASAARQALAAAPLDVESAEAAGLITMALDDLDYEDEVRLAVEERASLSPDALTGMEASLRFPGPETADSKIFARLSAWQNWIFQRPNAVGPGGALTNYGQPTRPSFDYRRT